MNKKSLNSENASGGIKRKKTRLKSFLVDLIQDTSGYKLRRIARELGVSVDSNSSDEEIKNQINNHLTGVKKKNKKSVKLKLMPIPREGSKSEEVFNVLMESGSNISKKEIAQKLKTHDSLIYTIEKKFVTNN